MAENANETSQQMPEINVYNELQFVAVALSQMAWQLMGLQLGPGQKETKKDMDQAKTAIDTVAFILEKIDSHITDDQRKGLQNILSDLQLNYMKQK